MTNLQDQDYIRDTAEPVNVDSIPVNDIPRAEDVRTEEFKINSDALMAKLNELLREANIRRILLKNDKGEILFELPLTVGVVGGVVGVVFLPMIAAIAAIGALVTRLTLVVEKKV